MSEEPLNIDKLQVELMMLELSGNQDFAEARREVELLLEEIKTKKLPVTWPVLNESISKIKKKHTPIFSSSAHR